ncbi:O-acetyl-ADP-ribose deacetylase [Sulfurimonas sp. HSL3-7]|uniref:O-acetyl-ADP-ribose deacetylase n=1 Tax=Sulfonitrofixus jiaomeiensis TaxID=3131938 RepID=UPI0031F831B2
MPQIAKKLTEHIEAKVGDITQEKVCAVVNAANSSLLGGGGVDGAIHRAGGGGVLEACRAIRQSRYPDGLPTGEAVVTTAGNMPADYVVHTVGPIYSSCGGSCQELLRNCYVNSLKEAAIVGCKSIAFPAISTGVYGYPKREAAETAFNAVQEALQTYDIDVTFIFHSESDYNAFIAAVEP